MFYTSTNLVPEKGSNMIATYEQEIEAHAPPLHGQALLDDLAQRLERGLAIIESRQATGQSVERLEEHWITLLREYEAAYVRAR